MTTLAEAAKRPDGVSSRDTPGRGEFRLSGAEISGSTNDLRVHHVGDARKGAAPVWAKG